MGDMGVVEEDDGAEVKAFKVQAKTGAKKGSVWWYDAGALKVAERMFKVGDKVSSFYSFYLPLFFFFFFFFFFLFSSHFFLSVCLFFY